MAIRPAFDPSPQPSAPVARPKRRPGNARHRRFALPLIGFCATIAILSALFGPPNFLSSLF
jgi:hypothetical protein